MTANGVPEGRMPTSKDVARIAGVAQSTVSYVMSGKRPISEKTRRLVQDAIDQLTYQPHAGARALASQRTNAIALVVPFRSSDSAHRLMTFAEEIALAARAHDHDVLLVTADEGPAGLRRIGGRALCDAVVVMEVATHDERVEVARTLSMPTVFIGFPADATGLHCIDLDFEGAAEILVGELHAAGNSEIHVLGWDQDLLDRDPNYAPRFRTRAEVVARVLGVHLVWHVCPPGPQAAAAFLEAVARHRPEGPRPGLLLLHNLMATSTALRVAGLRPGVDLDVVALADDDTAALEVPLTAVFTAPREVSRQAMGWVFALLDDELPAERRTVAAVLTRRGSVRSERH